MDALRARRLSITAALLMDFASSNTCPLEILTVLPIHPENRRQARSTGKLRKGSFMVRNPVFIIFCSYPNPLRFAAEQYEQHRSDHDQRSGHQANLPKI